MGGVSLVLSALYAGYGSGRFKTARGTSINIETAEGGGRATQGRG